MAFFIAAKYKVGSKLGGGAFCDIYIGTNVQSGEEVAIKFERITSKYPQLTYEAKVYKALAGGVGIPSVHWHGVQGFYNVMVMDLLGPSLEDLFFFCNRKFNVKTILMLADQMIRRVEYVHAKNYIHGDIKPDNFLIGLGKTASQVHIIDFGLSKQFRDPKTQQHIPYKESRDLTGTVPFASVKANRGMEQSRRDDLEAVGHMLIYFLRSSFPWLGLKASSKREADEKDMQLKSKRTYADLCKHFPCEFVKYINYCRNLSFEEPPDYAYLRQLFNDLFVRENYQYDFHFDWTLVPYQSRDEQSSGGSSAESLAEQIEV